MKPEPDSRGLKSTNNQYEVKIIDLSYHQDPSKIDYDLMANNADGFILRASYGTGVDGKWQGTDPAFDRHYQELCIKRGKPCGAYHFIVAYKPIPDQVEVMYNAIKDKKLSLGLWCDVETESGAESLKAEHVIEYMNLAEKRMGEFGIYNGHWCWMDIMGTHQADFSSRKLWMSAYTKSPDSYIPHGWENWWLWQFTSSARLPGYSSNLDVSYFNGTKSDFNKWKEMTPMLDIEPLSQNDKRWSEDKLGTSKSTIGRFGCLITSVSMMLRYAGFDTDPGRLNVILKNNGGYHNQNLFVWDSLSSIFPGVSFLYRYQPVQFDKIDERLKNGKPVIVNVDGQPSSSTIEEHWVLVVGKNGDDYIINDPIDGKQISFRERYGVPATKMYIACTYDFATTVPPQEEEKVLYKVKVKIGNLVIRSGPGTNYSVVHRYASGEYSVFEEKNGYGRIGTNRWISILPEHVEKVSDLEGRVADLELRVKKLEGS